MNDIEDLNLTLTFLARPRSRMHAHSGHIDHIIWRTRICVLIYSRINQAATAITPSCTWPVFLCQTFPRQWIFTILSYRSGKVLIILRVFLAWKLGEILELVVVFTWHHVDVAGVLRWPNLWLVIPMVIYEVATSIRCDFLDDFLQHFVMMSL